MENSKIDLRKKYFVETIDTQKTDNVLNCIWKICPWLKSDRRAKFSKQNLYL